MPIDFGAVFTVINEDPIVSTIHLALMGLLPHSSDKLLPSVFNL